MIAQQTSMAHELFANRSLIAILRQASDARNFLVAPARRFATSSALIFK
jgi:hypothetical protein